MVYLADHPAQAAMEVRVHLDLPFDLLPNDYVMTRVTLPGRLIETLPDMPENTVTTGTQWLKDGTGAALRVPSVLVPHAWNVLLNPRHKNAARARVISVDPFGFDPRLWEPMGAEG